MPKVLGSGNVIIVGAGPTGLSLALGLAREGVSTTVIERNGQPDQHARAAIIFPRTLEVFAAWKCLDRFLSVGNRVPQIRLRNAADQSLIVKFDFTELIQETSVPFALAMRRDETERLLLEAASEYKEVEVRFGVEALAFIQTESGVRLRIRRDGVEEWLEGSFLVGADGAHSVVRQGLRLELEGKTYRTRACVADIRVPPDVDQSEFWPVLLDERGLVIGIRFGDRMFRIVEDAMPDDVNEDNFTEHLERLAGKLFHRTPEILWKRIWQKHERVAPMFRVGRVLLAGDACHTHSPTGGLGMNSGIQDAHNLAWKLANALQVPDAKVQALLDSYSEERREAVGHEIQTFADMNETFERAPAFVRVPGVFLLSRLMGTGRSAPPIARRLSMLRLAYRKSGLMAYGRHPVGRRIPDVMTAEGDRLYGRFRGAAIVSSNSNPGLRAIAKRLGIDLVAVDLAELTRFFNRERYAAVIRPDRMIADVQHPDILVEDEVRRALGLPSMT